MFSKVVAGDEICVIVGQSKAISLNQIHSNRSNYEYVHNIFGFSQKNDKDTTLVCSSVL